MRKSQLWGFYIGVERIFTLKMKQAGIVSEPSRTRGKTDVYIIAIGVDEIEALKLAGELENENLN